MKKYEYYERFENWKTKKAETIVYNRELEEWEVWEDIDGILTGFITVGIDTHENAVEFAKAEAMDKIKKHTCTDTQVWSESGCHHFKNRRHYTQNRLVELGKVEPEPPKEPTLEELERRYFLLMMIDRPNWGEKEALREVGRKIKELGGTL